MSEIFTWRFLSVVSGWCNSRISRRAIDTDGVPGIVGSKGQESEISGRRIPRVQENSGGRVERSGLLMIAK